MKAYGLNVQLPEQFPSASVAGGVRLAEPEIPRCARLSADARRPFIAYGAGRDYAPLLNGTAGAHAFPLWERTCLFRASAAGSACLAEPLGILRRLLQRADTLAIGGVEAAQG